MQVHAADTRMQVQLRGGANLSQGVSGQVGSSTNISVKGRVPPQSRHPVWVIACLPRSPSLLQVVRRDVEIMRRIIVVSH